MRSRVSLKRVALVLSLFAFAQLLAWYSFARSQVLRRAFLHDEKLDEELVQSADFRPELYGDTYQFVVLCDELAEQLSAEEISEAADRLRERGDAFFDGQHSRLITYEAWMGKFRAQSLAPRIRVSGICANARLNTPILAKVECDDRFENPQHGHAHFFLHLFGIWIPIWSGGHWVT